MNIHIGTGIMDEAAYRALLHRRNEIQGQIRSLQEELRAVTGIIHGFERLHQIQSGQLLGPDGDDRGGEAAQKRPRMAPSPRELASLAREEILAKGRPLTRGDLVDALQARGVHISGLDKAKNLGTILWRFRDEFSNIPGRGYWPTDMPNPELNIGPPDDKSDD